MKRYQGGYELVDGVWQAYTPKAAGWATRARCEHDYARLIDDVGLTDGYICLRCFGKTDDNLRQPGCVARAWRAVRGRL